MKAFIYISTVILLIVAIIAFSVSKQRSQDTINSTDTTTEISEEDFEEVDDRAIVSSAYPPVFAWRFEEDDSNNLDGFPQTNIILEYATSTGTQSMRIDTVPGGCNAIDASEEDADMVQGTEKIQCYYAGLGHWYKIVRGQESYEIQRKTFEEPSPAYDPPTYEYETILEMPIR